MGATLYSPPFKGGALAPGGKGRPMPRSTDRHANNEYRREWLSRPGNAERQREARRRYRSKPEVKERIRAGRRERNAVAREIIRSVFGPRKGECRVCGKEFTLNVVGRPRIYCDRCVAEFRRSDRKCPRCGSLIGNWRRRLTCGKCGALWMRGHPR